MTDFDASAHPRSPNGQFCRATTPEAAGVQLIAADPAVQSAHEAALEFLDFNAGLEIIDRGAQAGKNSTVELHQMADPDTARGNCWAATNEIIELGAGELGAEWLDEITIAGRGEHVAVLAGYPDGHAVIDYTIRQFDPGLPFPWTGTADEWKAAVEAATGTAWEWDEDDGEG